VASIMPARLKIALRRNLVPDQRDARYDPYPPGLRVSGCRAEAPVDRI
jgi:hypothetical protein